MGQAAIPLVIAAVGSAVGGGLQVAAAKKTAHAMDDAYIQERNRQRRYQEGSGKVIQEAIPAVGADAAKKSLEAAGQARLGEQQQYAQAPQAIGMPAPTARDAAIGQLGAQHTAQLGSYDDWLLKQAVSLARSQQGLNMFSNFSQGQSNIFPLYLQRAQHKGDSLAMLGSLISGLSSLGSAYSASTMKPPTPAPVIHGPI